MSSLAPQPRRKVLKAITKAYGFSLDREGGKHSVFYKQGVLEPIVLPRHDEISPGVIRNICKIVGVTVDDFLQTLRHC